VVCRRCTVKCGLSSLYGEVWFVVVARWSVVCRRCTVKCGLSSLYGEVWFVVVVCVACVILLIVFTLLLVKCTCPRQRSYVRQRVPLGHVPLDQSVSTSPPSYRRHYYYQQPILFDKSRHTVCITPHLTNCCIDEGWPREKTRID